MVKLTMRFRHRANLSQIYFEQRQDRYVWLRNAAGLSEYYAELVDTLGRLSFQCKSASPSSSSAAVADQKDSTAVPVLAFVPPADAHPVQHSRRFKEKAYARLAAFLDKWTDKQGVELADVLKRGMCLIGDYICTHGSSLIRLVNDDDDRGRCGRVDFAHRPAGLCRHPARRARHD